MVLRIVIFEHWGQWTGRETGEREDRAFRDRIELRLLSLSLSNAMGPYYSHDIFAMICGIHRGAL